jgi:hypothetical protein
MTSKLSFYIEIHLLKIPIMLLFLVLAGIFPQCRGSLLCSDWITSAMGWSFNVTHCAHELNNSITMSESEYGYFQIAPFNNSLGNMSIAGRNVGPIIRYLIFNEEHHHHHQPHPLSDQIHMKIWRAKYFLPVPGGYLANIEIRYTEFDPENYETSQAYCKDNEIVKEYFWKVVSNGDSNFNASASLQECSSTSMTEGGYWITQVPHILPPKWLPDGGYQEVSARQDFVVEELEDHLFYQPKSAASSS